MTRASTPSATSSTSRLTAPRKWWIVDYRRDLQIGMQARDASAYVPETPWIGMGLVTYSFPYPPPYRRERIDFWK